MELYPTWISEVHQTHPGHRKSIWACRECLGHPISKRNKAKRLFSRRDIPRISFLTTLQAHWLQSCLQLTCKLDDWLQLDHKWLQVDQFWLQADCKFIGPQFKFDYPDDYKTDWLTNTSLTADSSSLTTRWLQRQTDYKCKSDCKFISRFFKFDYQMADCKFINRLTTTSSLDHKDDYQMTTRQIDYKYNKSDCKFIDKLTSSLTFRADCRFIGLQIDCKFIDYKSDFELTASSLNYKMTSSWLQNRLTTNLTSGWLQTTTDIDFKLASSWLQIDSPQIYYIDCKWIDKADYKIFYWWLTSSWIHSSWLQIN